MRRSLQSVYELAKLLNGLCGVTNLKMALGVKE